MKRSKIFITASMCLVCLAMLVVGVYAAVVVNFQINSSLTFNPEGVYIEMSGQVYRGSSYSTVEPIYDDTKNYTMPKTMNYVLEDGEASGNFEISPWKPSEVMFLPTQKFIQYRITITNHSDEPISMIPQEDLSITNCTITEETSAVLRIEAGDTAEYRLTFEYTGTSSMSSTSFSQQINISKTSDLLESQNSSGLTFSNTSGTLDISSGTTSRVLILPSTVGGQAVTSLKSGEYFDGSSYVNAFSNKVSSETKYVIIENGITSIGDGAFDGKNIEGVYFPESLTYFGDLAFAECDITYLVFKSAFRTDGIVDFNSSGFSQCRKLKRVVFAEGCEQKILDRDLFNTCSSLEEIELPNSLEEIKPGCFSYCTSLKQINIPQNVSKICIYNDEFEEQYSPHVFSYSGIELFDMSSVNWSTLQFGVNSHYSPTNVFKTSSDVVKIKIDSADLTTVKSKITSDVAGGEDMANKLQLVDENGSVLSTWNGTAGS